MVKEHGLQLRDTGMLESGEKINLGTEKNMTKKVTSLESM